MEFLFKYMKEHFSYFYQIHKIVTSSKFIQEYTRFVLVMDDVKGEHIHAFQFEKDQLNEKFHDTKQFAIMESRFPFLFIDQHKVFLHLFEDSFAYLLESSMEVDLVLFFNT